MRLTKRFCLAGSGLALLITLLLLAGARPALAQDADNQACLACHSQPGMKTELPSGEVLYSTVDPEVYNNSVHGQLGQKCVDCHTNISGYPHPPLTINTRRDLSIQLYRGSCVGCHEDKYEATVDSVHGVQLAGGNNQAPICTDCHGTHNITDPLQPLSRSSQMCELCHSQVFELYKQSVHGAALIGEGNRDVPACVDCHEVHSVAGPSTMGFRLHSPEICATCHDDAALMTKYGISTDVFDTYVSDFHGTTVYLFQAIAPDQETNKPVCIDCHGVHDMRMVDDPESTVIKENLLVTCQKCHPDANANFPTSWVSHYRPSMQHSPLVYLVKIFYTILIPVVLGGMAVFVVTDAFRRQRRRREARKEAAHG